MIKISKVSNISYATRKKLLESGARRVKASTVTPSFFNSFAMSYNKYFAASCAKFKKHMDRMSFSREIKLV